MADRAPGALLAEPLLVVVTVMMREMVVPPAHLLNGQDLLPAALKTG